LGQRRHAPRPSPVRGGAFTYRGELVGIATGMEDVLAGPHKRVPDPGWGDEHSDIASVRRLLAHLATLLADDGYIHILDLVLPARPSIGKALAEWDRGDYPRPLAEWQELFSRQFGPTLIEPHPLGAFRLTLWDMVYFKGRRA
jgi:hypothetical protein